jgi:hypothetical protein
LDWVLYGFILPGAYASGFISRVNGRRKVTNLGYTNEQMSKEGDWSTVLYITKKSQVFKISVWFFLFFFW